MASKICWLFLVMLLSISTFGLWMCCIVVISATSSLIGLAVMLYSGQELKFSINLNPKCLDFSRTSSPFNGIPKVTIRMNDSPIKKKSDLQLTGSNEIDAPLREILSYITRDFVCSWYKDVSTDEDFTNNFYEICKKLINNFSKSSREINWISFITQKVVEDFTTHLRLYRHAEAKFRRCQKEKLDTYPDIESAFFELESTLEKNICRKNVCTSIENENEYLQNVSDIILYLLLPPDDFNNRILKHFLREVMTCSLFQPLITQFSDPDVINQNLIWMCRDHPVSSKSLLGVLRRTDNKEELFAFRQITKHEIKVHNSKDTVDKDESKKYIKSITFVQEIANQRYERLSGLPKHGDSDSAEFYLSIDETDSPTPSTKERKLISLPFDVILTNNIALHYFTQYLANMDKDNYVFFYLNVESFRTTVEMLQSANLPQDGETVTEKLRTLALQLFDSYLGSNATSKINLDETLLRKLLSRIKTENITVHCFDEVQEKVYDVLENEFYLTGFKDTKQYVKLLAELDLLNDSASLDLDSLSSSKSEEEEKLICDTVVPTDEEMLNELLNTEISVDDFDFPDMSSGPLPEENKEIGLIFAEVHSTGITHHAGRTFAVYAISVSHHRMEGPEEKWFVVRRYSEFYDFHEMLIEKYPMLAYFNFPAKKPFNNLTRQLMEKRRYMLNEFMQFLLSPDILAACDGLNVMIYNFLQPNVCEKGKRSFIRSVGNFVNPIKSSVRTVGNIVKLVPDTFFELKDGLVKALSKSGDNERTLSFSASKPLPSDNPRTEDIPFRIILLLMDEVFNLRNKDLWFRRRIMALLRQIIKTMQGGSINRKIKDYVQGLTSATQIAEWLKLLSKTIWPDGVLADSTPERDHNTKMRTRIVAKMLLFCAIPDELKHIIGYETSFKGAMLIFNMFQHPALNNRLLLVLLESLFIALFPNNNMPELFQKLHSSSPRTTSILKDLAQKDIKEQQTVSEESQSIAEKSMEEDEVKVIEVKEKPPTLKVAKESRGKLMKQCLSLQNVRSPKLSKKKTTRSMDTAIFYTDYDDNEDTVILPLGR